MRERNIMKRFFQCILVALFLLNGIESIQAIEWQKDMDQALSEAKLQNKPVFAFFYHYLYYQNPTRQREDFLIWESPLVQKYLPNFIAVKVDVEGKDDIESKYGVLSFPTVLFFDPQGRELLSMRVEDKDMKRSIMAVRMKKVLQSIEEFTLVEEQIKTNDENPKLVLMYANGLRDRGMFERAEEQYYRLLNWKGLSPEELQEAKSSYTNMFFFQGAAEFYGGDFNRCIEIMQRFIDKNPQNDAVPQARLLMGMAMYESGRKTEGESILKDLTNLKNAGPIPDQAKKFLEEKKGGVRR